MEKWLSRLFNLQKVGGSNPSPATKIKIMNEFCKEYAKTHKVLTLQITRECFVDIMRGYQKTEHRFIYPRNTNKYVRVIPKGDGEYNRVETIDYDALYLINGRRKDAPRLLVEVERCEFSLCVRGDGSVIELEEDGVKYLSSQMMYYLGNVLDAENVEILKSWVSPTYED